MTAQPTISLRVTNRNDFILSDRYNGVPYVFEPKKPLKIPFEAAQHIFGWQPDAPPIEVEKHTCRRQGWNTPAHMTSGTGRRYFKNLVFETVQHRLVEVVDGEEEIPAIIPVKGGPKMTAQ